MLASISLRRALMAGAIAAAGCGGDPPTAVVAAALPTVEKIDKPPETESEIGGLNEEAMDKAFAALWKGIENCVDARTVKLMGLGGELRVKLRIDRVGNARWAYVSASTLGDREVEKCVVELARAKTWPLPVGGDGLAEKSFMIDPSKEPLELEESRFRRDVARARSDVVRCRHGVRGSFFATAYVRGDGKVVDAGVASPNENAEAAADCMVEALRKLRFLPAPGHEAKLSFEIK